MTDDLSVPDEYDEESYRAGYAQAMDHIGRMALQGASALAPADADGDSGEDVTECPDCGAGLLASMGANETSTPEGRVCPECEL